MAVRDFAGGGTVSLAIAGNNIPGGAYSFAWLLKRGSAGSWQTIIGGVDVDSNEVWDFSFEGPSGGVGANHVRMAASGGVSNSTFTVTTTTDYVVLVFTCAGGFAEMGRWHLWNGTTWTHEDGSEPGTALRGLPNIPGGTMVLGVGNPLDARVAYGGMWHANLTDLQVEALTANLDVDDWVRHEVTPASIWPFTQASTSTPVTDLIGNSDETAHSGTSVVNDDPPDWNLVASPLPLAFSFRLSGGAANSDPASSIGGDESSSLAPANLFDDVSFATAAAGTVDYRAVYVHNDDARTGVVAAYVSQQLESGREIAVGVATEDPGTSVGAIANDTTAPAGVSFTAPTTAGSGVDLGTLDTDEAKGLWIRRTIDEGTSPDTTNSWQVTIEVNEP